MKKVLLVTPPYHCGVVEVAGRWLPLALAYIAGSLRKAGFDVEIYDAMSKFHGHRKIEAKIRETRPDCVGVTACTPTYNDAVKVLKTAKKVDSSITTVMGGVHPTFCWRETLSENDGAVDFVIRGEGEETMAELLLALKKGRNIGAVRGLAWMEKGARRVSPASSPERGFIENLDSLSPAWDLLDWNDYTYFVIPKSRLGVVSSSRGCSNECAFCSQQKFWKRSWRGRNPRKFVGEVELLHERYGANVFLICDEFPTKDRERWEEILDRLIAKKLGVYLLMETCVTDIIRDCGIMKKYRDAGIVHIYVGVEATDQKTLDQLKKNIEVEQSREAIRIINESGIITETSFILGLPDETRKTISETLELAKYYNPDFAHFLALAPWPYADIYGAMEEFIADRDYSKYNLVTAVIKPKKMSLKQINDEIVNCYRKFYMSKLPEYDSISDEFKRKYLLSSMKVMMKSSFLTRHMKGLGAIPDEVEKYLRKRKSKAKKQ